MGARFVAVPRDRLRETLNAAGAGIVSAGGTSRWTRAGDEEVFEFSPPGALAVVRVFTTLDGEEEVRACGQDAVRIVLVAGDRPLGRSRRIFRTAPAAGDRVGAFLSRLTEALREAYRKARAVRSCPSCGKAMAERKGKFGTFLGCTGYPECSRTVSS